MFLLYDGLLALTFGNTASMAVRICPFLSLLCTSRMHLFVIFCQIVLSKIPKSLDTEWQKP